MIIIFLGPPGAGKGTQCKELVNCYRLQHLSSGVCLRRERQNGTELGQKVQSYMDSGQLVPDEFIVSMMVEEIKNFNGDTRIVLDGFPRTLSQARELDRLLEQVGKKIDAVLNLQVDDNQLELRITGRRSCPTCGAAYHIVFNKPQKQGHCDADGQILMQRTDDTPEVVSHRIKTCHQQTTPLIEYYQQQQILYLLNGNTSIEKVTAQMCWIIDQLTIEQVVKILFQARPLPRRQKTKQVRDAG
ncbi:adenylate kinase [Planctomycetota bacterium]